MPETHPESSTELAVLVGDVVAAYVSNNPVPPTSLPAFEPVAVYPVQIEGDDLLVDLENPINNPAA